MADSRMLADLMSMYALHSMTSYEYKSDTVPLVTCPPLGCRVNSQNLPLLTSHEILIVLYFKQYIYAIECIIYLWCALLSHWRSFQIFHFQHSEKVKHRSHDRQKSHVAVDLQSIQDFRVMILMSIRMLAGMQRWEVYFLTAYAAC
jgi:hypothetical protein